MDFIIWIASFMGRGVIEVPLKEVTDFVGDIDTTFVWDKFCIVRPFTWPFQEV